jgi:hypothetical protein
MSYKQATHHALLTFRLEAIALARRAGQAGRSTV